MKLYPLNLIEYGIERHYYFLTSVVFLLLINWPDTLISVKTTAEGLSLFVMLCIEEKK